MKTYRVATSAELEGEGAGARDEVFDVEADNFEIHTHSRGGVRVVRHEPKDTVQLSRWNRLRLALAGRDYARVNVAWVPHDSLLSIRELPSTPEVNTRVIEAAGDDATLAQRPAGWKSRPLNYEARTV